MFSLGPQATGALTALLVKTLVQMALAHSFTLCLWHIRTPALELKVKILAAKRFPCPAAGAYTADTGWFVCELAAPAKRIGKLGTYQPVGHCQH